MKMITRASKLKIIERAPFVCAVTAIVLWVAAIAAMSFIVAHFVAKYW